jgi:cytochrome c-type biogenesis protein CcmH/NrfG
VRLCEASALLSRSAKAIEALKRFRASEPAALSRLAKLSAEEGVCEDAHAMADEARRILDEALTGIADADAAKAAAYRCEGRLEEAYAVLERAVSGSKGADSPEHRLLLADICLEQGGERAERKHHAHAHLLTAAKSAPPSLKSQALSRLASWYAQRQDTSRGVQCAWKALQLEESNVEAAELVADLAQGPDALGALRKALSLFGAPDSQKCLKLAGLAARQGSQDDVIWSYQRALRTEPKSAQLWELLGRAYSADGRVTSAVKALRTCLEHEPTRASALVQCASQELLAGHLSAALQHVGLALEVEPHSIEARMTKLRSILSCAASSAREGAYQRAIALEDDACEVARSAGAHAVSKKEIVGDVARLAGTALLQRAQSSMMLEDDLENAVDRALESRRFLRSSIHACPWDSERWSELAHSCVIHGASSPRDHGRIEESIACASIALEPADSEGWHVLGLLQQRSGKRCDAVKSLFARALSLRKKNCDAWLDFASLLRSTDAVQDALANARANDPESARVWDIMGQKSHGDGDTRNALASFRMARDLHGGPVIDARFAHEALLVEGRQFALCGDIFASALRASAALPANKAAQTLRARAFAERRMPREARLIAQRLSAAGDAELQRHMNWLLALPDESECSLRASHLNDAIERARCQACKAVESLHERCHMCRRKAKHLDPSLGIDL